MDTDLTNIPNEEARVRGLLQSFSNDIQELLDMIDGKERLMGDERTEARMKLKTLKERLKKESRRVQTLKAEQEMSEAERCFYRPAVIEASANLIVSVGSIPNREWHNNLYSIKTDVDFILNQLL